MICVLTRMTLGVVGAVNTFEDLRPEIDAAVTTDACPDYLLFRETSHVVVLYCGCRMRSGFEVIYMLDIIQF
jgi:hypothetical protein